MKLSTRLLIKFSENIGPVKLLPQTVMLVQHGTGQICIVNRAPKDSITVSSGQINVAIASVLSTCCANQANCAGGQNKIVVIRGAATNVIDLSVQALGQNCTP
jgi:hypothetical protein